MELRPPIDAPVIQEFGTQRTLYRSLGQLGHNGIDYAAPEGTPVAAAASGTVVHAGWSQHHPWLTHHAGIAVLVSHGTHFTGYAHLSAVTVTEGQPVEAGEIIGAVGNTGTANGTHLHFEALTSPPDFGNGYAGRIRPEFTAGTHAATDAEEGH